MTSDGQGLDRRRFLQAGGLGAGLVALAVACVNTREAEQITQTGTRVPAPSTSVPPDPGTPMLDAQMVLTALSQGRSTRRDAVAGARFDPRGRMVTPIFLNASDRAARAD